MWPDQLDNRAYWFRQYFVGKPYITLVGMDQDIIISIVRERTSNGGYNHRVVYREKKVCLMMMKRVDKNVDTGCRPLSIVLLARTLPEKLRLSSRYMDRAIYWIMLRLLRIPKDDVGLCAVSHPPSFQHNNSILPLQVHVPCVLQSRPSIQHWICVIFVKCQHRLPFCQGWKRIYWDSMKTRSRDATSLVYFQCMMGKQLKKSGSAIRNYQNHWNDFSTSWANPLNFAVIKDIQLDWIQNVRK